MGLPPLQCSRQCQLGMQPHQSPESSGENPSSTLLTQREEAHRAPCVGRFHCPMITCDCRAGGQSLSLLQNGLQLGCPHALQSSALPPGHSLGFHQCDRLTGRVTEESGNLLTFPRPPSPGLCWHFTSQTHHYYCPSSAPPASKHWVFLPAVSLPLSFPISIFSESKPHACTISLLWVAFSFRKKVRGTDTTTSELPSL